MFIMKRGVFTNRWTFRINTVRTKRSELKRHCYGACPFLNKDITESDVTRAFFWCPCGHSSMPWGCEVVPFSKNYFSLARVVVWNCGTKLRKNCVSKSFWGEFCPSEGLLWFPSHVLLKRYRWPDQGSDYSSKDNKGEGTLLVVKIIHALRTDMKLIRDRTPASVLASELSGAAFHNFFSKGATRSVASWHWKLLQNGNGSGRIHASIHQAS
jgi:hypothetical protein